MTERFISPQERLEDIDLDRDVRPKRLADYIGQNKVKESLAVYIQATLARQEALDHVLLYGPPGLGKTTLAGIIANELDVSFHVTSGPAIERPGDLAAILTNLQPHDVLFIDEIHRLNRVIEEILYPAMEDFALDIIIGKGPNARSVRLDLHPFTLVGATTRVGNLSSPLRDRFGIISRLDFYSEEELCSIIQRSAGILKIPMEDAGALEVATRSRGIPRIANRLLRRVRDYAQVKAKGVINQAVADEALNMMEVDRLGLDENDRRLLTTIIQKYAGGPVGVDTLAASIQEESITIEDVYEPYLMQLGYIQRTQRGRVVTRKAYQYLGLPEPHEDGQNSLF